MNRPRARTPLAPRYTRTIHDATGMTVQYLEPLPDGTWRGWEIYDNGDESDKLEFAMDILPLGFVRCGEVTA